MSTTHQASVYVKNTSDGDARVTLIHENESNGRQWGTWTASPGQVVGHRARRGISPVESIILGEIQHFGSAEIIGSTDGRGGCRRAASRERRPRSGR